MYIVFMYNWLCIPKLKTNLDDESDTNVARLLFPLQTPQASVSIPDSSTLSQPTVCSVQQNKYNAYGYMNLLHNVYLLLYI